MAHFGAGTYGEGIYGADSQLTLVSLGDDYPDKVQVSASNLAPGQVVTISRTPPTSTVRTLVRGANEVEITSNALVRVDAEQPFGVLLTYYLTIDGFDNDTATITPTLSGSKVVLSDAVSGEAAEVVVMAWPSKRRERKSSVFEVGGRNIVVSGHRGGWSGTIDLFVESDESKNSVLSLLGSATSGVLQIRQAGPYDGVDAYISVLTDDEQRYSQDGSDARRIISLDVVETTAWADLLESEGFDLADIFAAYPSPDDLADLAADYATLYDIALGDFSA